MSDTYQETVGQITINFPPKGRPSIIIKGQINPRLLPGIPRLVQIAYRQYMHSIARAKKRVDMSDKGKKQEESQEAVPAADAMNNIFEVPPPAAPVAKEELVVDDDLAEGSETETASESTTVEEPAVPSAGAYKID